MRGLGVSRGVYQRWRSSRQSLRSDRGTPPRRSSPHSLAAAGDQDRASVVGGIQPWCTHLIDGEKSSSWSGVGGRLGALTEQDRSAVTENTHQQLVLEPAGQLARRLDRRKGRGRDQFVELAACVHVPNLEANYPARTATAVPRADTPAGRRRLHRPVRRVCAMRASTRGTAAGNLAR